MHLQIAAGCRGRGLPVVCCPLTWVSGTRTCSLEWSNCQISKPIQSTTRASSITPDFYWVDSLGLRRCRGLQMFPAQMGRNSNIEGQLLILHIA